jgi:hypothetical protein
MDNSGYYKSMDEWTKSEKEYFEEVSPRRLRALDKF